MNEDLLKEKLNGLRRELIRYNSQLSTGTPPENPGKIRAIKRTIARIYTSLKQLQASQPVIKEGNKRQ